MARKASIMKPKNTLMIRTKNTIFDEKACMKSYWHGRGSIIIICSVINSLHIIILEQIQNGGVQCCKNQIHDKKNGQFS